jgi:hypothetical protein
MTTRTTDPRRIARSNRRIAAALVLLGLLMQAVAPYLPMPAMGGFTSWELMAQAICADGQPGADHRDDQTHHGDCAACLVMQQASATLAPDAIEIPLPVATLSGQPALWQQAQLSAPLAEGFSSRAPPHAA